jgi:hypothetical protein
MKVRKYVMSLGMQLKSLWRCSPPWCNVGRQHLTSHSTMNEPGRTFAEALFLLREKREYHISTVKEDWKPGHSTCRIMTVEERLHLTLPEKFTHLTTENMGKSNLLKLVAQRGHNWHIAGVLAMHPDIQSCSEEYSRLLRLVEENEVPRKRRSDLVM